MIFWTKYKETLSHRLPTDLNNLKKSNMCACHSHIGCEFYIAHFNFKSIKKDCLNFFLILFLNFT